MLSNILFKPIATIWLLCACKFAAARFETENESGCKARANKRPWFNDKIIQNSNLCHWFRSIDKWTVLNQYHLHIVCLCVYININLNWFHSLSMYRRLDLFRSYILPFVCVFAVDGLLTMMTNASWPPFIDKRINNDCLTSDHKPRAQFRIKTAKKPTR